MEFERREDVPHKTATGSKLDSVSIWSAVVSVHSPSSPSPSLSFPFISQPPSAGCPEKKNQLERTNIVFPRSSSILHWSRYLASTFPAGHKCPPHPSFRSDSRIKGGSRRPEKSREILAGRLGEINGTRSSESMKNVLSELDRLEGDVICCES